MGSQRVEPDLVTEQQWENTASYFDISAKNVSPPESSHKEHQTFSSEVILLYKKHFLFFQNVFVYFWRTHFQVCLHQDL